jgi:hypothetical protein
VATVVGAMFRSGWRKTEPCRCDVRGVWPRVGVQTDAVRRGTGRPRGRPGKMAYQVFLVSSFFFGVERKGSSWTRSRLGQLLVFSSVMHLTLEHFVCQS